MRCPKCQYLGFEPSPRCKNCGYDFSFGIDDLPGLTIVSDADAASVADDFDLPMRADASAAASGASASMGFDLDRLLEHGRAAADPEPSPVVPAKPATPSYRGHGLATAFALATPPPEEVRRIVRDEPKRQMPSPVVAPAIVAPVAAPVAAPMAATIAAAPVTTELPLFMQARADIVPTSMPDTVEAAILMQEAPAVDSVDVLEVVEVEEVDDRPLIQVPATPRAPLAVRRATPDPARLRAKYGRAAQKTAASADNDLLLGIDDLDADMAPARVAPADRLSAEPTPQSLPAGWLQGVSASKRFSAAALDVVLLGGLNAAIIWLTLSVCGLSLSQFNLLPLVPIALFFLLVDGGYLVLFTAVCGQTIGKMAAGIRVVGTTTGAVINDRLSLRQSVMRALGSIASCLPLGAGLWMTLLGDGRALHDRIAQTRVVRA
ncbi:MAG: RDD family protein [Acidobacteria bacterium]|nr:RDD family protein [Acidobacteriota bacterium]